jgi:hypothetical protein
VLTAVLIVRLLSLKVKVLRNEPSIPNYLDWRENVLVREILKAKLPEPGGGCNVERSRMRRAIH